jgi:hypothetical protein
MQKFRISCICHRHIKTAVVLIVRLVGHSVRAPESDFVSTIWTACAASSEKLDFPSRVFVQFNQASSSAQVPYKSGHHYLENHSPGCAGKWCLPFTRTYHQCIASLVDIS